MSEEHAEPADSWIHSLGRHVLAAIVLLICAFLLLHFLFGLIVFVATIVAVVVAIIGAIWAIRILFH